jgi:hypothetical protein
LTKLNTFSDPSGLSIEQIQKKLIEEDPSILRKIMEDLRFDGEDPDYEKQQFLENLQGDKAGTTEKELRENVKYEQLKKHELATEIYRS